MHVSFTSLNMTSYCWYFIAINTKHSRVQPHRGHITRDTSRLLLVQVIGREIYQGKGKDKEAKKKPSLASFALLFVELEFEYLQTIWNLNRFRVSNVM